MRSLVCPFACPVASRMGISVSAWLGGFGGFVSGTDLPLAAHPTTPEDTGEGWL